MTYILLVLFSVVLFITTKLCMLKHRYYNNCKTDFVRDSCHKCSECGKIKFITWKREYDLPLTGELEYLCNDCLNKLTQPIIEGNI